MTADRAQKPARVLIVEDHPMFRERMAHLINQTEGMQVCGDVRCQDPAAVHPPGPGGKIAQAGGLPGADPSPGVSPGADGDCLTFAQLRS
jgi:hypothetical protein